MNNFLTIYAASEALERDRRSVKIALRYVRGEQIDAQGRTRWRLSTIIAALRKYDQQIAERASNGGRPLPVDPSNGSDLIEVERAAHELDALMKRLRREPDISKRRTIVEGGAGKLVGALKDAMDVANRTLAPHERPLVEAYCDGIMGGVISEMLGLLKWTPMSDEHP